MNNKLFKNIAFQFIYLASLIAFIPLLIFFIDSFNTYPIGKMHEMLNNGESGSAIPIFDQLIRFFFVFDTTTILFSVIFLNVMRTSCENEKVDLFNKYTLFLFSFVMIPKYINLFSFTQFKEDVKNFNTSSTSIMSLSNLKNVILRKQKFNFLTFNTIFLLFLSSLSVVTIILMIVDYVSIYWLDAKDFTIVNQLAMRKTFLFGFLIYFTNVGNILCFGYIWYALLFPKNQDSNQGEWFSRITAYIVVVFLIFWAALFPGSMSHFRESYPFDINFVTTLFTHLLIPTLFTGFFISTSFLLRKTRDNDNSKKINGIYLTKSMYLPLYYGIVVYASPFVCQFSVYGSYTNLNNLFRMSDGSLGNVSNILWLLIFAVLFLGLAALFKFLFNKISFVKKL